MYSHTYSELVEELDFILRQDKELGDTAADDKYRILPRSEAKNFITNILYQLVGTAKDRYEYEVVFKFYDDTETPLPTIDERYIYVNINGDNIQGNLFILPQKVQALHVFYDTTTARWVQPYDSSMANLAIYSPSHDRLYNEDGWNDGDELRARCCVFPNRLKENIDAVSITDISSASQAVVTLSTASTFERGDTMIISGVTPSTFDGSYSVLKATSTTEYVINLDSSALAYVSDGTAARDTDSQKIEIDDEFYRMLILEIKRAAYANKKNPISQYEYAELMQLQKRWQRSQSRMRKKTAFTFQGYRFGRR